VFNTYKNEKDRNTTRNKNANNQSILFTLRGNNLVPPVRPFTALSLLLIIFGKSNSNPEILVSNVGIGSN
jgi:hypothetical protein